MTTHRVHQLPTVGVDKQIIFPKTWANHIHNLRPEFLLPFRKQWEDSDVMLASTQETIVSSFKLQQASEGKSFYFILACPCICKHLCLKDIEAYIEGSGWGLLHPEQILKQTTGENNL
jgi:hypothetical protein